MPWHVQIPNLNSIESIRVWIDKELVKVQISSTTNLKQKLDTVLRRVPTETRNNFLKSMQKR